MIIGFFCREFNPDSSTTGISDNYWCEKLKISSIQDPMVFNGEETISELKLKINEYIQYTEKENIFPDTTIVEIP